MLFAPIAKLLNGEHLSRDEARAAMQAIMTGEVPPARVAALLTGLAIKRETVDEVAGFVDAMLAGAEPFPARSGVVADTCGTGGDRSGTFNISTAAAFVVAGAGLPVAKHGNRSMTSKSGSADVLEAAGVAIDQPHAGAVACLDQTGITFLFAPVWHPAMKHVGPVRRELGFPTVFNLLGPLANPARPAVQLMGVSRPDLTAFMAGVLAALGTTSALVVHGDGLDEISVCAPTTGHWLNQGEVKPFRFSPAELGWELASPAELLGGTPEENAAMLRGLLQGTIGGAKRRAVLVNAGAALMAAGKVDRMVDGVELAATAIDSGAALAKLDALVALSREARQQAVS